MSHLRVARGESHGHLAPESGEPSRTNQTVLVAPAMRALVLIDLYVPARLGSPVELQFVARKAGLDAIIRVAEDSSEQASAEELAALDPLGPAVLPAVAVVGPGFRFVCLLPGGGPDLESLEATGDARLVQTAVAGLGGIALPCAPRRGPAGTVARTSWDRVPGTRVGVVALTVAGSLLGRDLDLEDTVIAEKAVLGGSGPFASHIGRYATFLPAKPPEPRPVGAADVVEALARGLGFAVEMQPRGQEVVIEPPDPQEGREEGGEGEHKRRRRRRRRN